LAKIADMKIHKNPCSRRRGKTGKVMDLVLVTLSANAPKSGFCA